MNLAKYVRKLIDDTYSILKLKIYLQWLDYNSLNVNNVINVSDHAVRYKGHDGTYVVTISKHKILLKSRPSLISYKLIIIRWPFMYNFIQFKYETSIVRAKYFCESIRIAMQRRYDLLNATLSKTKYRQ